MTDAPDSTLSLRRMTLVDGVEVGCRSVGEESHDSTRRRADAAIDVTGADAEAGDAAEVGGRRFERMPLGAFTGRGVDEAAAFMLGL